MIIKNISDRVIVEDTIDDRNPISINPRDVIKVKGTGLQIKQGLKKHRLAEATEKELEEFEQAAKEALELKRTQAKQRLETLKKQEIQDIDNRPAVEEKKKEKKAKSKK